MEDRPQRLQLCPPPGHTDIAGFLSFRRDIFLPEDGRVTVDRHGCGSPHRQNLLQTTGMIVMAVAQKDGVNGTEIQPERSGISLQRRAGPGIEKDPPPPHLEKYGQPVLAQKTGTGAPVFTDRGYGHFNCDTITPFLSSSRRLREKALPPLRPLLLLPVQADRLVQGRCSQVRAVHLDR